MSSKTTLTTNRDQVSISLLLFYLPQPKKMERGVRAKRKDQPKKTVLPPTCRIISCRVHVRGLRYMYYYIRAKSSYFLKRVNLRILLDKPINVRQILATCRVHVSNQNCVSHTTVSLVKFYIIKNLYYLRRCGC